MNGEWESRGGAIYCSPVTRALLFRKHPALETRADVVVVALSLGRPHVITLQGGELLTVTPLDAGHCPGSVGFLFEGACGRIYHTGDFRREDWCGRGGAAAAAASAIPECLTRAPLDLLLLDNTYANPTYDFPARSDAAEEVLAIVSEATARGCDVYVGIDSLGKEALLTAVATATGAAVRVTPERAAAAAVAAAAAEEEEEDDDGWGFGDGDGGDGDGDGDGRARRRWRHSSVDAGSLTSKCTASGRVFAVPKQQVTRAKLAHLQRHSASPIVGVLPTGWAAAPWASAGGGGGGTGGDVDDDGPALRSVPYSLHAPFAELEAFVKALRPIAVVGNTRPPRDPDAPCIDVGAHFARWCRGGGGGGGEGGEGARDAAPRDVAAASAAAVAAARLATAQPRVLGGAGHAILRAFDHRNAANDDDDARALGPGPGGGGKGLALSRAVNGYERPAASAWERDDVGGDTASEPDDDDDDDAPPGDASEDELDALAAAFAVDVLKMARRDGRGRGKRARDAADDAWERLGQAASSPSSLPATGKQRWQSKRRHVPGWFAAAGRRVSGLFRAASSPGGRGDAS